MVQAEKKSLVFGDFASAILQIAEEKGIGKDRVVDIIGAALAAAYKREYGKKSQNIRGDFHAGDGTASFWLVREVVDDTVRDFAQPAEDSDETPPTRRSLSEHSLTVTTDSTDEERLARFNPERDVTVDEAKIALSGGARLTKMVHGTDAGEPVVGDAIETELPYQSDFGRVAAQTAKQVIIQKIRESEREKMYAEFKEREGEVVNGVVERIEGRNVIVSLGKSYGVLSAAEQVRTDRYRMGQRLRVLVLRVSTDTQGPCIILSRSSPMLVRKLFELEVPELYTGTVVMKAIAREPGSRTKMAVSTDDKSIDPIGSCVGQKGTRVQSVIDELGGEKIDIIQWQENTAQFIAAALSPAKVTSVELIEVNHHARVIVPEDQLSLAIGRGGQNVRLASQLTGWELDVVRTDGGAVVLPDTTSDVSVGASVAVDSTATDVDSIAAPMVVTSPIEVTDDTDTLAKKTKKASATKIKKAVAEKPAKKSTAKKKKIASDDE